jgi:glycosyltransferase involved in cell wall biosynthesis
VTIAEGIEGISFPSKLYSSLAVGKPVIAISEPDSELREVVEGEKVGRWVKLGDADGLAAAIRGLMKDPQGCLEMGERARSLMERRYAIDASARQYAKVLLSVPTAR